MVDEKFKKAGTIYVSILAGRAVNKYLAPKIDEYIPPMGDQWYQKWSNLVKIGLGLAVPLLDYLGYIPPKYEDALLVFGGELLGDVIVDPPTEVPVANLEPVEYTTTESVPVESTTEEKKKIANEPVPVA